MLAGGGGGGYGGGGGGRGDDFIVQEDTVFVSGMNQDTSEEEISQHFGSIGVIKVRILCVKAIFRLPQGVLETLASNNVRKINHLESKTALENIVGVKSSDQIAEIKPLKKLTL